MDKNLKIIDDHIHLDHHMYGGKGQEIMRELIETGFIDKVVIPPISFESNFTAREMFSEIEFGEYVFFAAGVHPKLIYNTSLPKWLAENRGKLEGLLSDARTVAIKTGLEFSKKHLQESQKEHERSFMRLFIDYANGANGFKGRSLPLILHIRDASEEALEVLKECPVRVNTQIHCFTCDYNTARSFMDSGVEYFGIGGHITRSDADALRDSVAKLPISSLLLETDGPFKVPQGIEFMKPVCFPDPKVSTSLCLPQIAGIIAGIKHVSVNKVIEQLYMNAREFFGWE